jgi:hypothetical protein
MSGCEEDQTSADAYIDGRYCGAFTSHLIHRLKVDGLSIPRTELRRLVNADLDEAGYAQDPELHGNPAVLQYGFQQGGAV